MNKKIEEIAELIFEEAIENSKRREGKGLSPTLVTDWTDYIESYQEDFKSRKIAELEEEIKKQKALLELSKHPENRMNIIGKIEAFESSIEILKQP